MRIAWFTPFNPESVIGRYSETVAGLLAEREEVVVFASEQGASQPRPSHLRVVRLPAHPDSGFLAGFGPFDVMVYNLGDHFASHETIFRVASTCPGIVILHDLVLHDFFRAYYKGEGEEHLAQVLGYAGGAVGRGLAAHPLDGGGERPEGPIRQEVPLFRPALHRALGVIVHSEYAREHVQPVCPAPLAKLEFPLTPSGPVTAPRPASGLVRVLSFGALNADELIHWTIRAIAGSPTLRRTVAYTVMGPRGNDYSRELVEVVASSGLGDSVSLAGNRSDAELAEALHQTDIVVNLGDPHRCESAWGFVHALAAGVPAVVRDHGFYEEFPAEVVSRIRGEVELGPALERLVCQPTLRTQMGRLALADAAGRFSPARYRDGLIGFLHSALAFRPALELADRVSDILVELGSGPLDGLSAELAPLLDKYLPGKGSAGRSAQAPARAA